MSFLKEMFKTEKPIIGLLHLKPLPGDPFYAPGGSMEDVIACAGRIWTRCKRAAWTVCW